MGGVAPAGRRRPRRRRARRGLAVSCRRNLTNHALMPAMSAVRCLAMTRAWSAVRQFFRAGPGKTMSGPPGCVREGESRRRLAVGRLARRARSRRTAGAPLAAATGDPPAAAAAAAPAAADPRPPASAGTLSDHLAGAMCCVWSEWRGVDGREE